MGPDGFVPSSGALVGAMLARRLRGPAQPGAAQEQGDADKGAAEQGTAENETGTQAEGGQAAVLPTAGQLLESMSAALGGANGGERGLAGLAGYHLSFERRVMDNPSGKVVKAEHELWVQNKKLRMDIDITEGEGVASRMVVVVPRGAASYWVA